MNDLSARAGAWIRFLRQYGPIPQNENMYDEFIRRSAERAGVAPFSFDHPHAAAVMDAVGQEGPVCVVLTGTAGDGKTHLCRRIWENLGGEQATWQSAEPYLSLDITGESRPKRLHLIRDLSAWAPLRGSEWDPAKGRLLDRFSALATEEGSEETGAEPLDEIFVIAANDGQLVESWNRLPASPVIDRTKDILERLLVEDRQQIPGNRLHLFNLSRSRSSDLFDRAIGAFLDHSAWELCRSLAAGPAAFFGPNCPIRRNVELLGTSLVRGRLRALFELCDYSQIHLPIRQVLLLLANAVLGHPDAREGLLRAEDIPRILENGTVARASLYSNIFGANLKESRRESTLIFEAFDRFGVGYETSNRIDNILIYGDADPSVQPYFDRFMAADRFYGADDSFRRAQQQYVESAEEDDQRSSEFLQALIAQRRGMFFKIPEADADELGLWELTVFRYAGEYLKLVSLLEEGRRIDRPVLARLVRGLNRVFTGMLLEDDRELLLATSIAFSQQRVSPLLEDRVSVDPRRGERVDVLLENGMPTLAVSLGMQLGVAPLRLTLHLVRFEFLSRVAEGALPSSFSKECYEDIVAFKTHLLTMLEKQRHASGEDRPPLAFRVLTLDDAGKATQVDLEVLEDGDRSEPVRGDLR